MSEYMRHIWGTQIGDFNAQSSPEHLARLVEVSKGELHWRKVFAPRCGFTTRIATLGAEDYCPDPDSAWFVRTRFKADGGIVECPDAPVMIFNADCPVVVVFDAAKNRLALLHAGLRCLIPDAVFDPHASKNDKRSILQVCFEDCGFSPADSEVFVGYGIGPCCYGILNHQRILQDSRLDVPLSRATRGPRAGQPSVDILQLCANQLAKIGVPRDQMEVDYECTSCRGRKDGPLFYSHARSGGSDSRNCSFAWFVQ